MQWFGTLSKSAQYKYICILMRQGVMRVHDQNATRMQNVQYGRKRETGPKRGKKKAESGPRREGVAVFEKSGGGIYSVATLYTVYVCTSTYVLCTLATYLVHRCTYKYREITPYLWTCIRYYVHIYINMYVLCTSTE